MTRRGNQVQPGTGKIKSVRPRDIRAGHHEGAEIVRHGRSDQSPKPGHRALPRADHSCRLNAPWLQP